MHHRWSRIAPWPNRRQIEQDLIISRALVAIFSDPFLHGELRFRGGKAKSDPSPVAPKLRFRVDAEGEPADARINIKVEINTRDREAYDPPIDIPFGVESPWFTGKASIPTFSREEMLATKLRALLQRDKGRDLFDLDHALAVFKGLNTARIVECFLLYLAKAEVTVSRAEAQRRMFQKLANPTFFIDLRPLLPTDHAGWVSDETLKAAFVRVVKELIDRMPGDKWAKAEEMRERFGV